MNLEQQPEEEIIKGEGFTVKESEGEYWGSELTRLRFSGKRDNFEQVDQKQEELKNKIERISKLTEEDCALELLKSMLDTNNPFSEIFRIKPDGKIDKISRFDGSAVYWGDWGDQEPTTRGLYAIAKKISEKYPEYNFSFENDPEGNWIKYTVTRKQY